jgi:hypothetical protein
LELGLPVTVWVLAGQAVHWVPFTLLLRPSPKLLVSHEQMCLPGPVCVQIWLRPAQSSSSAAQGLYALQLWFCTTLMFNTPLRHSSEMLPRYPLCQSAHFTDDEAPLSVVPVELTMPLSLPMRKNTPLPCKHGFGVHVAFDSSYPSAHRAQSCAPCDVHALAFAASPFLQVHRLASQIALPRFIVKLGAVQFVHRVVPCCGHFVSTAALPIGRPFWTPLHPPSAVHMHVQALPRHVSAVPSIKSYPSEHALVWLLPALLHVSVTPGLECVTAEQGLHTVSLEPWHDEFAYEPLSQALHALQVSALPLSSTRK